jgi:methyl-accepting chemotaxis protein
MDNRGEPDDAGNTLLVTGRMAVPTCLVSGIMLIAWALSQHSAVRIGGLGSGALSLAVAAWTRSVAWERVPPYVLPGLVVAASANSGLLAYLAPNEPVTIGTTAIGVLWLSFSLRGIAYRTMVVAQISCVTLATILSPHGHNSVIDLVVSIVAIVGISVLARLVQQALYRERRHIVEAQLQAAERDRAARAATQTFERERAQQSADGLAARSGLLEQILRQATYLNTTAGSVREEAQSVAAATQEMVRSIDALSDTAQVTKSVSDAVSAKADDANTVMRRLSAASTEIMSASTIIQGIAEQTNLLALNATIEAARAGEAGRGFAVVASEVKDLAQQSGASATRITTTLEEVRTLVAQAVEEVVAIMNNMAGLNDHNNALASAVEEQAITVQEISRSVTTTTDHVEAMANGIVELEGICTAG